MYLIRRGKQTMMLMTGWVKHCGRIGKKLLQFSLWGRKNVMSLCDCDRQHETYVKLPTWTFSTKTLSIAETVYFLFLAASKTWNSYNHFQLSWSWKKCMIKSAFIFFCYPWNQEFCVLHTQKSAEVEGFWGEFRNDVKWRFVRKLLARMVEACKRP